MSYLQSFQQKFDRTATAYLDKKISDAAALHPRAVDLLQVIKDFIRTGGRRFRPALFYYAYGSTGKKGAIDPLASSLIFELFHTFALIHDDIIDNAPLRRSVSTVNKKHGVPVAVLAGDLALNLTDEMFMETVFQSQLGRAAKDQIRELYNAYKQELIAGQYLDYIRIPESQVIMHLKTSLYSFVRPSMLGFLFGGSRQPEWEQVLEKIGILFQMKDDYDGMFGNEKTVGKSVTSDIEEGKNTKIIELFLRQASSGEAKKFKSFFGREHVSPGHYRWLKEVLREKKVDGHIRNFIISEGQAITARLDKATDRTPFHGLVGELIALIGDFS